MSENRDDFEDEGEYVDSEDFSDGVEENEDGSAVVTLDSEPRRGDSEFYDNLAEVLPSDELGLIASNLLDLIEQDKEARSKRDEQYKKGLQRTGLGDDAPGGAEFEGASRVVHPMLTEVSVDFSSRAIKELWPANGPVKSKIVGPETESKWDKAQRKTDFMNWQLTIGCPEARTEFEQMLTQLPLGGGQYMKLTWDEARNRPSYLFIAIDDIYLPFSASNFYTAQRKTHVQYLTQLEFESRVRSGMYVDIDATAPGQAPERSAADIANDKIEGREDNSYNTDGVRTVFEVYVTHRVPGDELTDAPAPYIISVDQNSRKVLSIYRNWDEEDEAREELQWIVEFPFVPWRGAYPIGMTQMIGGLSGAATGALRALLDAAHISNSQTMLKLKGGTRGGQSLTIQPTEVVEIEGGMNVDDIRKMAMPLPFNQPSETLFRLLGFLVEAGKGVVRTTLDPTIESQENTPVGTTLARIEQGMTVFSAIHERLHNAMQRMLAIQHRLNAMYLDDARVKQEVGSVIASRADFDGPLDVVPVSDPRIFSEAQRFAQTQAVAQRAQLNPALYNARKVEERILKTLNVPGYEELLAPEVTPKEENAVAENVKAVLGKPIVAFPDQDHIAHLKTHLPFMQSPVFGASRLIAPTLTPIMLNHIKEHLALWYAQESFATADEAAGGELSEMILQTKDKGSKQALDNLVADASQDVVETAPAIFQGLPEAIEQAMQLLQQLSPPGPQDPATQVAMADVQMRGQTAQARIEFDKEKAQLDAQKAAAEQAAETQRVEIRERHEDMRTQIEVDSRVEMNDADNQTAEELALLRLAGGASASMNANPNPQPR
jgi:hypothetical protein